ncbi:unnamed protein product [Ranitomeya imitator]|uniref:Otopetrin 2 n=1 Tax=Ranitomeya imitator TaxID=111125 RepID=A0ABN9LDP8_9NEOB|nr:unnamed protein product [Ranitomeya imitator]
MTEGAQWKTKTEEEEEVAIAAGAVAPPQKRGVKFGSEPNFGRQFVRNRQIQISMDQLTPNFDHTVLSPLTQHSKPLCWAKSLKLCPLWLNACHRKYGLMLVLITNLSIWMAAVTDESVHETRSLDIDLKEQTSTTGYHDHRDAGGAHGHTCRCSNHLCHIFQTGYYYLYPFNIEYSLFASAMTYVMWKNVGREMDDNMPCHPRISPCFCFNSVFVGLLLGGIVFLGGIVALVTYKVQVNIRDKSYQAHIMFYSFNVVVLSIMSMGSLTGSIIYRFDKRDMDGHKNPTRTLDVTLLLGAALGQYCISYYSIVAMVATTPGELLNALNLMYSLLMIVQLTLQNTFIIEGLHREPFRDSPLDPHKELVYTNESVAPSLPVETSPEPAVPFGTNTENSQMPMEHIRPWNLKRRLVQEISLFLLLCNIILWLLPAFGARPQLRNDLELKFYGPSVWAIITNISLPFGIFYRMHGAASLLEVFRMRAKHRRETPGEDSCDWATSLESADSGSPKTKVVSDSKRHSRNRQDS